MIRWTATLQCFYDFLELIYTKDKYSFRCFNFWQADSRRIRSLSTRVVIGHRNHEYSWGSCILYAQSHNHNPNPNLTLHLAHEYSCFHVANHNKGRILRLSVFILVSKMEKSDFDNENLINAVQSEKSLWDTMLNASEEEKELAWKRIADAFGINKGLHLVLKYVLYTDYAIIQALALSKLCIGYVYFTLVWRL